MKLQAGSVLCIASLVVTKLAQAKPSEGTDEFMPEVHLVAET